MGTIDIFSRLKKVRMECAAEGKEVFDFSMINPDLVPDRYLQDKLVEASLNPGNHRYAVSRGIRKLREAFAVKYRRKFGVEVDPEREICVTMGSKDAVLHTMMSSLAPGERVLAGAPVYPAYIHALSLARLPYDLFDAGRDEDAALASIERKLASSDYKMILINYPSNPGGRVVSQEFLAEVLNLGTAAGCIVLNDFTYGELGYGQNPSVSLLSVKGFKETAVEAYSMSKAYSIPGWRVGALVGSAQVVKRLAVLKSQIDYGIFLPIQIACAAALATERDLAFIARETYKSRAELLTDGLNQLGWKATVPEAGASVWAQIPDYGVKWCMDGGESRSLGFSMRMLKEFGIFMMPGVLFGEEFDNFVRFALVSNDEQIKEALFLLEKL